MWGWLKAIFQWLGNQLGPYLRGIVENLRRFKWFLVALVGAILAPINWVLDWLVECAQFVYSQTADLLNMAHALDPGQSSNLWNAISAGAALMNCVVPLDYAVAVGSLLMGWLVALGILRAILWAYKTINPFK